MEIVQTYRTDQCGGHSGRGLPLLSAEAENAVIQ